MTRIVQTDLIAAVNREAWAQSAACTNVHDGLGKRDYDSHYPEGREHERRAKAERAIAICAECPVRIQCITYALDRNEVAGVWGGFDLGTAEGRRLARAYLRRSEPRDCPKCGRLIDGDNALRNGKRGHICRHCRNERARRSQQARREGQRAWAELVAAS